MSPVRQLLYGLALGLAIAATMAPSASAVPIDQVLPSERDNSKQASPEVFGESPSSAPSAIDVEGDDGFDWGAAVIGAAGVFTLVAIGAGGALVLRGRRRPGGPATTT
jgi:hypothetical protein